MYKPDTVGVDDTSRQFPDDGPGQFEDAAPNAKSPRASQNIPSTDGYVERFLPPGKAKDAANAEDLSL